MGRFPSPSLCRDGTHDVVCYEFIPRPREFQQDLGISCVVSGQWSVVGGPCLSSEGGWSVFCEHRSGVACRIWCSRSTRWDYWVRFVMFASAAADVGLCSAQLCLRGRRVWLRSDSILRPFGRGRVGSFREIRSSVVEGAGERSGDSFDSVGDGLISPDDGSASVRSLSSLRDRKLVDRQGRLGN